MERETAARVLEALVFAPLVSGTSFFSSAPGPAELNPDPPPIGDVGELRGNFWPEDEGPDDFVKAVRTWRRDGGDA